MSSAGIGEVISMVLKKEGRLYDNIYIISNVFTWDKNGNAISIREPIIHAMNKDETEIKNLPVFDLIKNRKNVLLLGDNLEDAGMVKGFDYKNLIKIGFLNENVKENLERYKNNFDVVILNDISLDYVNQLLKEIIK
jgi:5'-nucleotidase